MKDPFVIFWTGAIFLSVGWYGFLVVYLGKKAGKEIIQMIRALKSRPPTADK